MWVLLIVRSLFCRLMAVSISLAQNLYGNLLLISIESFIMTIMRYFCLAGLLSLYTYKAVYFIKICFILQNIWSLFNKNFSLPSTLGIFIKHPFLTSSYSSHAWNISMKLFLPCRYKVQVFQVYLHISIIL